VRHLFALLLFKLLQVFESNGNYLDDELFLDYSFPYLKRISERVRERLVEANVTPVPMVRYLSPPLISLYGYRLRPYEASSRERNGYSESVPRSSSRRARP